MIFLSQKRNRGFTLIEMVVSVALFIVVALVAVTALLKVIDANKKAQGIKTAVNNLNYALESMVREMRVGITYSCSAGAWRPVVLGNTNQAQACSSPISAGTLSGTTGWTVAFHTPKRKTTGTVECNLIHAYHFNGKVLYKGEQTDCGYGYQFYPLIYGLTTATDFRANDSAITFNEGSVRVVVGDGVQPYAQFHFTGSAGVKEKIKSYFDIQTTVSQRLTSYE